MQVTERDKPRPVGDEPMTPVHFEINDYGIPELRTTQ